MRRGVIVGKFYPPHKGHKLLIDAGLAQTDQLTVIVCELSEHTISGRMRASWLKEIHPRARVIVKNYDGIDPINSKLWARLAVEWAGFKPDVVFTSEDYGDPWAKEIGCEHVLVDISRQTIPISATKIRENPLANWKYLEPVVKAHYAKRVVVLGAESTGTTTLAKDLAEHYKTCWVPEYGRFYSEGRMYAGESTDWEGREFVHIAKMQNRMEDALAKNCNKLLVCDTDSFATTVWHKRYMGKRSKEVEKEARDRKYDLYILTDVDIPFVQDGLRDGEHIRSWMHEEFKKDLDKWGKDYIVVSGSPRDRLKKAVGAIDSF